LVELVGGDTPDEQRPGFVPPAAPVPTPRVGARPRFDQVVGVGPDGRALLAEGGGAAGLAELAGADRSLALGNIRRDIARDAAPVVHGPERWLGAEGWDLLDDPATLARAPLHPLLFEVTPFDVKERIEHLARARGVGADHDPDAAGPAEHAPPSAAAPHEQRPRTAPTPRSLSATGAPLAGSEDVAEAAAALPPGLPPAAAAAFAAALAAPSAGAGEAASPASAGEAAGGASPGEAAGGASPGEAVGEAAGGAGPRAGASPAEEPAAPTPGSAAAASSASARDKTLREVMAVEHVGRHDAAHLALRRREKHRAVFAGLFRRMREGGGAAVAAGKARAPHSAPCGVVLGKSPRAPPARRHDESPGPGAYALRAGGALATVRSEIPRLAGLGLALAGRPAGARFAEDKSEELTRRTRETTVVVRALDPGGAAALALAAGTSALGEGARILRVDGKAVGDVAACRRALLGVPGTVCHVVFRHAGADGEEVAGEAALVRRYVQPGLRAPRGQDAVEAVNRAWHVQGSDWGVAQGARLADAGEDLLGPTQETEALRVMQALSDARTPARWEPLKHRSAMVPALLGIGAVTRALREAHPEWGLRSAAVLRLFKKHGLIAPNYASGAENPGTGPGSTNPQHFACHGWGPDGAPLLPHTSAAYPGAVVPYRVESAGARAVSATAVFGLSVPYRHQIGASIAQLEEEHTHRGALREAELYVFRRHLRASEYGRLPARKATKLLRTAETLRRLAGGEPGPITYRPAHPGELGAKKFGVRPSSAGAHLRGPVIGQRLPHSAAGDLASPGPARYDIRRPGLAAAGDFAHLRGSARMAPACGPARASDAAAPGFTSPTSSFASLGDPIRGTPLSTGGTGARMLGRSGAELAARREAKVTWHPESRTWEPGVPGPGAYSPRAPPPARVPTLCGRGSIEAEQRRAAGLVRVPAPGDPARSPTEKGGAGGAGEGHQLRGLAGDVLRLGGPAADRKASALGDPAAAAPAAPAGAGGPGGAGGAAAEEGRWEWVPAVPGPNAYHPQVGPSRHPPLSLPFPLLLPLL
jgi:hypothetical protein